MLTGDKRETAVNIAYACKLLEPEDRIFTLKSQTRVSRKVIFFSAEKFNNASPQDNTEKQMLFAWEIKEHLLLSIVLPCG